ALMNSRVSLNQTLMSLATPLLRVSCSICRGTLRRRPRPNPPPIHTAVVPELPGSLNGIDAGILPPRRVNGRVSETSPKMPALHRQSQWPLANAPEFHRVNAPPAHARVWVHFFMSARSFFKDERQSI